MTPVTQVDVARTEARKGSAAPHPSVVRAFINRHPLLTYFVLAFAISWGGALVLSGPGGLAGNAWQSGQRAALLGVALLAGPSVASVLLTALIDGRPGLRELLSRFLRWRVGAGWYALALMIAPLLAATTTLTLALFPPLFLPAIITSADKASLVLYGILAGLVIGVFEEVGWTGFAIPRLRLRYGVVTTGLMLGVLWGAWHFIAFWETDSFSGALPLALLLARLFSWLPPFRLFMVWVYERTGSLLVAVLMHASLVANLTVIFMTGATSHVDILTFVLAWAAMLWVVVAAVAVVSRWRIVHQILPMPVA
jgi:membrane protease YdiL (CAAX protease family)